MDHTKLEVVRADPKSKNKGCQSNRARSQAGCDWTH